MLRKPLVGLALAALLAACGKLGGDAAKAGAFHAPVRLLVAPEDLLIVQTNLLASGPVVTGSVQPSLRADLRAEVSAVVLQVLKENGDAVKRGDVLVRLDETAIRDSLNSADEAARVAARALDQAERALQRHVTLRAAGMTSAQAQDDAEARRNSAQSELAGAKSRAAQARQQLQRTLVRAPFDGLVSERKVSAGDTAAIGKELLKVVDPASMRFEGRVSADQISAVKLGQPVRFRVGGYAEQEFHGVVRRIDPAANDVTRQVEVLVGFADGAMPRVSGLYAEGRIDSDRAAVLMLPEGALVKDGEKVFAWRLKDQILSRVGLVLGARDPRSGQVEVRAGLAAGDLVMRHPGANLKDGQATVMVSAKVASAGAAASAPGK